MITLMSTSTEGLLVPVWDLADRLSKALREADMSVNEMAMYLGVHRNTVSAWVNGRTPISGPAIRAWATRCAVDYDWLESGVPGSPKGPDGLLLPRVDSNHEPAGEYPELDFAAETAA